MKRNILLLMILTVISLGASGQKYTIYVDDFDSEIKIPNRAINLIRLINGQNTAFVLSGIFVM